MKTDRLDPVFPDRAFAFRALFWGLLSIHLALIWIFPYFPTQDGPAHVDNARIIAEHYNPSHQILKQYHDVVLAPVPNLSGHLIMAALQSFVSPRTSEKILLSMHVFLLPLAFSFIIRAIQPDAEFIVLFSFPYIFAWYLHMGFYNYALGLSLFLLSLGYWLKHRDHFVARHYTLFFLLVSSLYFCHVMPYLMALGSMILLGIVLPVVENWHSAGKGWRRIPSLQRILSGGLPLLAFVPTLLLGISFLMTSPSTSQLKNDALLSRLVKLAKLPSFIVFGGYDKLLSMFAVFMFLTIAAFLLYRRLRQRTVDKADAFFVMGLTYVALFLLVPSKAFSGAFVDRRLIDFAYCSLLLWFASHHSIVTIRRRVIASALALAMAVLFVRITQYADLQEDIQEYLSVAKGVDAGSTVLPLYFADHVLASPEDVRPIWHLASYITAESDGVDLANYQTNHKYFPTRFRAELDPNYYISAELQKVWGASDSNIDFLTYPDRTGAEVDYVLVWGLQTADKRYSETKVILGQLEKGYELACSSKPYGRAQLYRRKSNENRSSPGTVSDVEEMKKCCDRPLPERTVTGSSLHEERQRHGSSVVGRDTSLGNLTGRSPARPNPSGDPGEDLPGRQCLGR